MNYIMDMRHAIGTPALVSVQAIYVNTRRVLYYTIYGDVYNYVEVLLLEIASGAMATCSHCQTKLSFLLNCNFRVHP